MLNPAELKRKITKLQNNKGLQKIVIYYMF